MSKLSKSQNSNGKPSSVPGIGHKKLLSAKKGQQSKTTPKSTPLPSKNTNLKKFRNNTLPKPKK